MERSLNKQLAQKEMLEKFISNYKKDGKERRTAPYYKKRLHDFQELFSKFQKTHTEILMDKHREPADSPNLTHAYFAEDLYADMEEFFYTNYAAIQTRFEDEYPTPEPELQQQDPSESFKELTLPNKEHFIKLPKISLEKFSGDYRKWTTFHDLFISLIHENRNLSRAQKLQYLKLHLSGEAEGLLRQVQVTNDNYEPAWKLLVDRYDNKRVLVNSQLSLLFSQPTISNESAQGIKSLMDVTTECLQALYNLGIKVESWDAVIIYTIVQKLPPDTHQLWEQSISKETTIPSWDTLREFMEGRFRTLEAVAQKMSPPNRSYRGFTARPRTTPQAFHATNAPTCNYCRSNHSIRQCQKFIGLSVSQKLDAVKTKGLCINCLGHGHLVAQCPSKHKCNICHQNHHSLLHRWNEDRSLNTAPTAHPNQPLTTTHEVHTQSLATTSTRPQSASGPQAELSSYPNLNSSPVCSLNSTMAGGNTPNHHVLLPTALVRLRSTAGRELIARALIDQGSQVSIVTESVVQKLNLKKRTIRADVNGVGLARVGYVNAQVEFTIRPHYEDDFSVNVSALVMKNVTNFLPTSEICKRDWDHISQLRLADPHYYHPAKIDILIGADIHGQIIMEDLILTRNGSPVAQKTALGWILSGRVAEPISSNTVNSFHVMSDLHDQMKRFWELEEVAIEQPLTKEEQLCEEHFSRTHNRRPDGRYEVELPLSDNPTSLGTSRHTALSRLHQSENRLRKNPELKLQYDDCLKEYLTLKHMEPINTNEEYPSCYLPHHAVLKEDSTTTKLRVVFNASSPTSNGLALNTILLNGPVQQDDLYTILLRWRIHRIAFSADIAKMYRQIWVSRKHTDLQRIVWRESAQGPVKDFRLLTVTFGTKSAPYLATRVIKQLAIDEQATYPVASAAAQTDFYVDDLMSGADTVMAAIEKQTQLRNLLTAGGFQLRKWVSNSPSVLEDIPAELRGMDLTVDISKHESVKALGLYWNPGKDTFSYSLRERPQLRKLTKRSILSEISTLFDPLGWLAPVIVRAKIMMQKLWLAKINWDDLIPMELQSEWVKYQNEIQGVNKIEIKRWLNIVDSHSKVELHGFSDASIQAYAAVIYLCAIHDGERRVNILAAKTKVAPIKTVSLPRLELCGAVLLTKLLRSTRKALKLPEDTVTYAWTDSEIVLAWLKGHPTKWKTFIANRVSLIHDCPGEVIWGHVPTSQNPADCATRGLSVDNLKGYELWWKGPEWLTKSQHHWPTARINHTTELEQRKLTPSCATIEKEDNILQRFSSLTKLVRVISYCKRFINNCRKQIPTPGTQYLTNTELKESLGTIIKLVQRKHFAEEISSLNKKHQISKSSPLIKLTPFLDQGGILRVSGRLKHSLLRYEEKHPVILPDKDYVTRLIIDKYHKETLHGGPQMMMSVILRKYWIINARNTIRFQIHKCITCYKQKAATQQQLMGDLPQARVRMSRPFSHTGVDYCGPFELKTHKGRGAKKYKGYLAIFVCMTTRALHIEIVTDLSSQGFIAAYRRFVSRRGKCSDMYCDCGSNFIGANKVMTRQASQMASELNMDIASTLETEEVTFHFIPPASPHFGGLWESGVRSTKHHLKRILGTATLTYEEFNTVITQIEACLNSRPLGEISNDPEDLTPLTPAHFLIGDVLLTPPEPSVLNMNIHRLDRWQYIQQLYQTFWKRWNSEYLSRLQQRPKWTRTQENIKIGQLVVIKEDNLPPSQWMLGRILHVHPGSDQLVRVVTNLVTSKNHKPKNFNVILGTRLTKLQNPLRHTQLGS